MRRMRVETKDTIGYNCGVLSFYPLNMENSRCDLYEAPVVEDPSKRSLLKAVARLFPVVIVAASCGAGALIQSEMEHNRRVATDEAESRKFIEYRRNTQDSNEDNDE